jgi:hypothetical protein
VSTKQERFSLCARVEEKKKIKKNFVATGEVFQTLKWPRHAPCRPLQRLQAGLRHLRQLGQRQLGKADDKKKKKVRS